MPESHTPWWRGERGEWLAAGQLALVMLVVFGPSTFAGLPKWPVGVKLLLRLCGTSLMICGVVLGVAALRRLRASLTALGGLKPEAALVTDGPYRFVRHPVYTGLILLTSGWTLALGGWLTSLYVATLIILLDIKSRREERRLLKQFAAYRDYQLRTHKLVPFIY